MPTLAFVDHSFHQYSRSGDFLRDIFKDHFTITDFWDNAWKGGKSVAVSEINKFDYVFFFQVLNPISELKKITARIIWAPMYDGFRSDPLYWRMLSFVSVKIIAFSKKIEALAVQNNVEYLTVKYFPKAPAAAIPKPAGNHFIFWYRGSITFTELKKHIHPKDVDSFLYISNPDPGYAAEQLSDDDVATYKINKVICEKFLPKEKYLALVTSGNIYVAPRKKEGIGMGFLEALSLGLSVVAYNDATMNEYIEHGRNGYLFNENSGIIDFSSRQQVAQNAADTFKQGLANWQLSKSKIIEYMRSEIVPDRPSKLKKFKTVLLFSLQEIYLRIKNGPLFRIHQIFKKAF